MEQIEVQRPSYHCEDKSHTQKVLEQEAMAQGREPWAVSSGVYHSALVIPDFLCEKNK